MGTWLTSELVLAVLVALCGVFILAGVVKLIGCGGDKCCAGSEKREFDRNGSA